MIPTTAWLTSLLLSWTGGGLCTEVLVIDPPVQAPPFIQMLGKESAHIHQQTVSRVLVGDRLYTVATQETSYVIGTAAPVPVAFQVYVNDTFVPGGGPRLDVAASPRPAWCSLPTGTPLHP